MATARPLQVGLAARFAATAACLAVAIGLMGLAGGSAHALPITQAFTGTINFADDLNPFGVAAGGAVGGSVTFDDAIVTGVGAEQASPSLDSEFLLNFLLGSGSFDEAADLDFPAFPLVAFIDGQIASIDFLIDSFAIGSFTDLALIMSGTGFLVLDNANQGNPLIIGTLSLFSSSTSLPEPAAFAVLALGLIGLGAARRRKRTL